MVTQPTFCMGNLVSFVISAEQKNEALQMTELKPYLVQGGDAIYMEGYSSGTIPNHKVWLDHLKVSRIGRQIFVTGKAGRAGMTITNFESDGKTVFSMSCNGHHTWTFLFDERNTDITMLNNYVHGTSGRAPKSSVRKVTM